MGARPITAKILAGAFLLALLTSCGGEAETSLPLTPTVPYQPVPVLKDVMVTGPEAVAPGQTAPFSATAIAMDLSRREVTSEVTWTSSDELVASVSKMGLVTGHVAGEVLVEAKFQRTYAAATLLVLPSGTSLLTGNVWEGGPDSAPVRDAVVEVAAGTGRGNTTSTDLWGEFRLYGVRPDSDIRVAKNGFKAVQQSTRLALTTGPARLALNVTLIRSQPLRDHSGTYTLTVTAACEPGGTLLPALRTRTYSAVVRQDGRSASVDLSGTDFALDQTGKGGGFRGDVDNDDAVFSLDDYWSSWDGPLYPSVIERLSDGTTLVIAGVATLRRSASRFEGTLQGWITHLAAPPPLNGPLGAVLDRCESAAHGFTLRR